MEPAGTIVEAWVQVTHSHRNVEFHRIYRTTVIQDERRRGYPVDRRVLGDQRLRRVSEIDVTLLDDFA